MAAETSPNSEILTAINNLAAAMTAGFAKMSTPAAEPKKEELKADPVADKFSADEVKVMIASSVKEELTKLKKTATALGYKADSEQGATLASGGPDDLPPKEAAKPKGYFAMVSEKAATGKMSRAAAGREVMETNEGRAAYASYIAGLNNGAGIYRRERMAN